MSESLNPERSLSIGKWEPLFLEARTALARRELDAAKELLEKSVQQAADEFGETDRRFADSLRWLALALATRMEYAEAEFVLRETIRLAEANTPFDLDQRILNLQCLAYLYEQQQRSKNVEEVHEELIALYERKGLSPSSAEMVASRAKSWDALLAEREGGSGTLVDQIPAIKPPDKKS